MDPHAVLGVAPGASAADLAAAYRREAKRWHPDRGGGEDAQHRMAAVNAAYEELRRSTAAAPGAGPPVRGEAPAAGGPPSGPQAGDWLAQRTRWALGPELLGALEQGEAVHLVTPVATWASPRSLLALTDRRLLWLHDDAIMGRVRSLRFRDVEQVTHHLGRPRRRWAVVHLRTRAGKRVRFREVPPGAAVAIEHHVAGALATR
ncbi:MAG TPA: DnaJ domain-containing protein [Solirubrobacteraceae bacterium]|nr:DnaJ domain-containing protein [Solirubrobacteraceae bacterium]